MSSTTHGPTQPTDASTVPAVPPASGRVREPSPLALAAMAAVAVPGLDPARLALPQQESATLRVVGVIDSQGRHWEVLQARTDAAGAALDAEAEVLRRIGRVHDDGRLSFDVSRPAGSLRREGVHVQVRSHVSGRPVEVADLHPGPGLSAGLGKALGELHELPTEVVSEAGLPVYDAEDVRERWVTVLDEAAATGKVPPSLLRRWEQVLQDTALWRFRPSVVHGDLAEENVLVAGGAVVGVRGLDQAHVGDPAEDMAWVYANVPVDCLDSVEDAYDVARTEGVDRHLRDRAELVSEMSLARWLLHGVRSGSAAVTEDAVSMLLDLAAQVGQEPLVEVREPRLAPVPGEREVSSPSATTSEIEMVSVDDAWHGAEADGTDEADDADRADDADGADAGRSAAGDGAVGGDAAVVALADRQDTVQGTTPDTVPDPAGD
ncbi:MULTISPECIES: phosphotransferase [unclassified Actinomyces]|uniref:phosphotransferase n=1 Tax=unclassified Actinomyces TaxID=2609248 RepID=UPI0020170621|nr:MULTISPECIES: phosphotransferase [unclassified Actinomyces]MCL3778033.1 phosphotransferase [Actinomyces sp. AC-20-1]MCL3789996.1 phosphotransferase [Actinomyces sp. 187325]MCL3791526.1 phosphotransferase [Actinomyces sp. 186855]MCL3793821.1 phosphotransferase [Actinomyces sp. 217892]